MAMTSLLMFLSFTTARQQKPPPPLLLQQGLRVLLVLLPPGVQLRLHGVHVLLDVVHDLPQGQRAAAHRLDGGAEPLDLPRHHVPLLLPRRFGHHVLEEEGGGGGISGAINLHKHMSRSVLHMLLFMINYISYAAARLIRHSETPKMFSFNPHS